MSEGKPPGARNMSTEARLIVDICTIANRPFVEGVENNFAGYFNELGVTIKCRPAATDEEIIALQNELLAFFKTSEQAKTPDFTWIVNFTRGGKKLRSLLPGDAPRAGSEDLEWVE
jgi:hypothetical protein